MSLAIAFATAHGVVLSADRCICTTLESGKSFMQTRTERKLFLSEDNCGFTYTGDANFEEKPTSFWMERFISRYALLSLRPDAFVKKLCIAFHQLDSDKNVVIIGAGYSDGLPQVYSCGSQSMVMVNHLAKETTGIIFSGENALARNVIDMVPIQKQSFTVPDAIEFVKHVTLTVSNIQRFGQVPVTVSPDCDILAVLPNDARWVIPPVSLGWHYEPDHALPSE